MDQFTFPNHPDGSTEYIRLQETCDLIDREIRMMEDETGAKAGAHGDVIIKEDPDIDDETLLNIFMIKIDRLRQLSLSAGHAYFARLDFKPDAGSRETHYIGRWGIMDSDELTTSVVDWRSPIANLYYSGQLGRVDYEAPDGAVRGELTLKRMLTVSGRMLEGIFDTEIVSRDVWLQSVLGSVSSDRLKEIVTTIQAEQNRVIRSPLRSNLIVQGAAGSGKTTIALHRIAWLLYTYRETLRPERVMILAPNPLFLSYISQVLPDLGVDRVIQTTFEGWCRGLLGRDMPKVLSDKRLEEMLSLTEDAREAAGAVVRRKGSLALLEKADRFLEHFREDMLPREGLVLSGVPICTYEELKTVFLIHLKHFPLASRVGELKKIVRKRLTDICGRMKETIEKNVADRLNRLLATMPDGEERRAKARKLLDARDERLSAIDRKAMEYLKSFSSLFPDLHVLSVYRRFLEDLGDPELSDATLPLLEAGTVRTEDLGLLCVLYHGLHGTAAGAMQHIVIDECQDFSPCQIALLRRMYPTATMTAVGDLTQGIHADEGIRSWQEWTGPIFLDKAVFCQLTTSYRNTVEIMDEAVRLAARFPIPGVEAARPVLRHGAPVRYTLCADCREQTEVIFTSVREWQREGYHTVALIVKTAAEASALAKRLKSLPEIRLLKAGDTEYTGGVLILPASLVKGMEFDCVLICNASAEAFPEDEFLSRILYVMMTRPLHCLRILSIGEPSSMLPSFTGA